MAGSVGGAGNLSKKAGADLPGRSRSDLAARRAGASGTLAEAHQALLAQADADPVVHKFDPAQHAYADLFDPDAPVAPVVVGSDNGKAFIAVAVNALLGEKVTHGGFVVFQEGSRLGDDWYVATVESNLPQGLQPGTVTDNGRAALAALQSLLTGDPISSTGLIPSERIQLALPT